MTQQPETPSILQCYLPSVSKTNTPYFTIIYTTTTKPVRIYPEYFHPLLLNNISKFVLFIVKYHFRTGVANFINDRYRAKKLDVRK